MNNKLICFTGVLDTYFIDEHPELFKFAVTQNRAQKLLNYIGQVLVNGPQTPLATPNKPATVDPHVPQVPLGNYYLFIFHLNYNYFQLVFNNKLFV